MNGAEGIRIGPDPAATAVIPRRSVPGVPHDISEPMLTASSGPGSEAPTWTSILEALGLTTQTSAANVAGPSESLPPRIAGSAEASEETPVPASINCEGGEDGGVSEGFNRSPRLLREARLPGTAAASRSPRRAAALQTDAPRKGNSNRYDGGP